MARFGVVAAAVAGVLLSITASAIPAPVDTFPIREFLIHPLDTSAAT